MAGYMPYDWFYTDRYIFLALYGTDPAYRQPFYLFMAHFIALGGVGVVNKLVHVSRVA